MTSQRWRNIKSFPGSADFRKMEKNKKESLIALGDLPESCLSKVFEFTTPKDVCKLSVLGRSFKSAGNSNWVWEKMLPPHYKDLLARASSPLQFDSKKELYLCLCKPVSIDNGTKKFWIDKATGKLCFMLSARELHIIWAWDNQYWHWKSQDDSSFEEIAELIKVCWLQVQGHFDSKVLSPGIAYTVSFRLKLNESASNQGNDGANHGSQYGWDIKPVKFALITPWGSEQHSARFLQNTENLVDNEGYRMTSFRHVGEGWMEFDAGEFVVQENEDGPKELYFHMNEVGGNWKAGLLLDGVKIQPSFLVTESHNVQ